MRIVGARPQESIPEAIRRESDRLHADLVVIGSEGRGVSEKLRAGAIDLRIPTTGVESLNASVAAGVMPLADGAFRPGRTLSGGEAVEIVDRLQGLSR